MTIISIMMSSSLQLNCRTFDPVSTNDGDVASSNVVRGCVIPSVTIMAATAKVVVLVLRRWERLQ